MTDCRSASTTTILERRHHQQTTQPCWTSYPFSSILQQCRRWMMKTGDGIGFDRGRVDIVDVDKMPAHEIPTPKTTNKDKQSTKTTTRTLQQHLQTNHKIKIHTHNTAVVVEQRLTGNRL